MVPLALPEGEHARNPQDPERLAVGVSPEAVMAGISRNPAIRSANTMLPLQIEPLLAAAVVRRLLLVSLQCPLMALSGHGPRIRECLLSGVKRT